MSVREMWAVGAGYVAADWPPYMPTDRSVYTSATDPKTGTGVTLKVDDVWMTAIGSTPFDGYGLGPYGTTPYGS